MFEPGCFVTDSQLSIRGRRLTGYSIILRSSRGWHHSAQNQNQNRWHELRSIFWHGLPGGSFLEPVKAMGGGFGEPVLRSPFSPTFLPGQPLLFPPPHPASLAQALSSQKIRGERPSAPTMAMREKNAQCVKSAAPRSATTGRSVPFCIPCRVFHGPGLDRRRGFSSWHRLGSWDLTDREVVWIGRAKNAEETSV